MGRDAHSTQHITHSTQHINVRLEQSGPNHSGSCVLSFPRPTVQEESQRQPKTLSSSQVLPSYRCDRCERTGLGISMGCKMCTLVQLNSQIARGMETCWYVLWWVVSRQTGKGDAGIAHSAYFVSLVEGVRAQGQGCVHARQLLHAHAHPVS
jgi:hypothetical protein